MNPAMSLYMDPRTGQMVERTPAPTPAPTPTPVPEPPTEYYARDPRSGQLYRISPDMRGPAEARMQPDPIPAIPGLTVYDRPPYPNENPQASSLRIPSGSDGRMPSGDPNWTPPHPGQLQRVLRALAQGVTSVFDHSYNYDPTFNSNYTRPELEQMYPANYPPRGYVPRITATPLPGYGEALRALEENRFPGRPETLQYLPYETLRKMNEGTRDWARRMAPSYAPPGRR